MSAPNPDRSKRAAGILLMTPEPSRQFLLMRHADRWDLPKGHCEPGETDIETALRETEEETGISADQIKLDAEFRYELSYPVQYKRHAGQVFQKTVVYFVGEISSAVTPHLTEHPSSQWFEWTPPHQIQTQTIDPLLEAVRQHLAQSGA